MLFKIYGERNSGTTFLRELLLANNFPVYEHDVIDNVCYYWKHGVLNLHEFKQKDEQVIDVFIFRNLTRWLKSTWINNYHLQKKENYRNFLTEEQIPNEDVLLDYKTHRQLNEDDSNKTIFEIRYYKFQKIMEYKNNHKDVVFVNLEFIQNKENVYYFLQSLNEIYIKDGKKDFISEIATHTKIDMKIKNRIVDVGDECFDVIKKYQNNTIEDFIDNLTFKIYK